MSKYVKLNDVEALLKQRNKRDSFYDWSGSYEKEDIIVNLMEKELRDSAIEIGDKNE